MNLYRFGNRKEHHEKNISKGAGDNVQCAQGDAMTGDRQRHPSYISFSTEGEVNQRSSPHLASPQVGRGIKAGLANSARPTLLFFIAGLALLLSGWVVLAADLDQSAKIIRKQIEEEKTRAQKLESQKKRLEGVLQSHQQKINRFNNILQNYEYNVTEAQKVIEAAESEKGQIQKRMDERELLFYRCIFAYQQSVAQNAIHKPGVQMRIACLGDAVGKITNGIFTDMQMEAPRLTELAGLIAERQDYQERILTKYLPIDEQKKTEQESVFVQTEQEVKTAVAESDEAKQKIEKLGKDLAAAEKKIEEIRKKRQEEEKRRLAAAQKAKAKKEADRKAKEKQAQASKSKTAAASTKNPKATPTPKEEEPEVIALPAGAGFGRLKGKLTWPARGKIVRPYGEFTHPQFQVKMNNRGIDVQAKPGAALQTAAPGEVVFIGDIAGLGNTLIISHDSDYMTVYGNVNPSGIREGQAVKAQQVIGAAAGADSSGVSIYHFEVRHGEQALNPQSWLQP